MKFTSEDLMKAMGLKVGDRVSYEIDNKIYYCNIYTEKNIPKIGIEKERSSFPISCLIDLEIEILPQPKHVGDLKCATKGKGGQENCSDCPVRILCESKECMDLGIGDTLYSYLETYQEKVFKYTNGKSDFDQEIYDILKKRLDKEVKDNE